MIIPSTPSSIEGAEGGLRARLLTNWLAMEAQSPMDVGLLCSGRVPRRASTRGAVVRQIVMRADWRRGMGQEAICNTLAYNRKCGTRESELRTPPSNETRSETLPIAGNGPLALLASFS